MTGLRARRARWAALGLCVSVGCGIGFWRHATALASQDTALSLTTSSFRANGDIPARFTCEGADASPALSWGEPPSGTNTFALVMSDPDAPGGNFVHWVIYDLPASTRSLPEGVAQGPDAAGGHQGPNSFEKTGYNGPCPPPGKPHRYFFRLWALDSALDQQQASAQTLESAARGHILARGELMGRFRR